VRTARLPSTVEDEDSLVLCADFAAIETVDGADDDALINGADDDALINGADDDTLTVDPGANPIAPEEPVHVGNKRGRGLDFFWEYRTDKIHPHLTSQSKCKACNMQFT
jgi:hypothetical protein